MSTANPASLGFDAARLARVPEAIAADVEAGRCDGAVVLVARHGEIVLHEAIGQADRAAGRPARLDDVYCTMSVGKQFTNTAVLQRVERGDIALTMPVTDVLPDYGQRGKARTTIGDLMIHRAGLPLGIPPLPPEILSSVENLAAFACTLLPLSAPGTRITYSAVIAHALLAEIVRRVDGGNRPFRRILADEVFDPLGMTDTCLGLRPDLAGRRVPVVVRDRTPGMLEPDGLEAMGAALGEDTEIPAGGFHSTAADVFRFAEAMRRGGELDGARVLGPAVLRLATSVQTGTEPNQLWEYAKAHRGWPDIPANLGYGFFVRGEGMFPMPFGTMASPGTFGGMGAGSSCFWVDPARDLVYVFFSAGLMEECVSTERHQRLSDMVFSALVH